MWANHFSISIYAAVVSTLTGAAQIWNYYRDRSHVKVTVRQNMRMFGVPKYEGKLLCVIQVSNLGRRPVTIITVGAHRKFPEPSFVVVDCLPPLPHELTEGKSLQAILEMDVMDLSKVLWWHTWDAVGREYTSKEANFYSRWKFRKSLKRQSG